MGVQVTLKDIQSGFLTAVTHTANNTLNEAGFDRALDRTANVNNAMAVNLDMGGQRSINHADGIDNTDAVTVQQLNAALAQGGTGIIASQIEEQLGSEVVASVTTFTGIVYTVAANNLEVYRNGNRQSKGRDYTETSSSSITWVVNPNGTDNLTFRSNTSTTTNITTTAAITHTDNSSTVNLETYLQNQEMTLAEAVSSTTLHVGAVVAVSDRAYGIFEVVLASGVTPNTFNIVQCTGVATLALVLRVVDKIKPEHYGVVYDSAGASESNFDTLEYIGTNLVDGDTISFKGGDLHLSHSRGYNLSFINGWSAIPIQSVKNITLIGNGTVIKVVDHDLAVNNGLMFCKGDAVQGFEAYGFEFEMHYVNRNNSADYYPFNGGIEFLDTLGTVTSRTYEQRSSNILVHSCTFNNFHPEGSFGQALNSFPGDPNNGFKVYGVTVFGDREASAKEFQNSNVTFRDNNFLPTHNGYGFWSWAYNNVTVYNNKATEYNSWSSDSSGVTTGVAIPMIRYHQWFCSGVNIYDNQFTARNETNRVGSYIGNAIFCNVVNNLAIERQRGETNVHDNILSLRTSDLGIVVNLYGTVNINDNIINGVLLTDRPQAGIELSMFEKGRAFVNISGNTSDANFSGPLIRVDNSADVAANRRIKTLNITNNTSLCSFGSAVFFVNTSGGASVGVEKFYASNNIFDFGDSEFSAANSNGTAIFCDIVNEATDVFEFKNNTCLDYYGLDKSGTQVVRSIENTIVGSTAFTSYNYLASIDQQRTLVEFVATEQPRVGLTNNDLFRFSAVRSVVATGVVQQQIVSEVAGGTAIGAGVTPAGETWRIDQTLIASKRDF